VFVAFATLLILVCIVTFFDVVFPAQFLQPQHSKLRSVIGFTWCTYILYTMGFHYFMAVNTPPGSPSDPMDIGLVNTDPSSIIRSLLRISRSQHVGSRQSSSYNRLTQDHFGSVNHKRRSSRAPLSNKELQDRRRHASDRICKKCPLAQGQMQLKPERAHHCRICGRCYLKYDHHCPWINSCVGLRNERYFFLFMVYLCIACCCVVWWGFFPMLSSLDILAEWDYYTPRVCTAILWVITSCIGFALFVMASWQFWIIARGETSVESSDNDYYRKLAQSKGKVYRHPFDLGLRQNLEYFFNIGPDRFPAYTILLPWPFPPASDGWAYAKREGWEDAAIHVDDELTDEEDEEE